MNSAMGAAFCGSMVGSTSTSATGGVAAVESTWLTVNCAGFDETVPPNWPAAVALLVIDWNSLSSMMLSWMLFAAVPMPSE